MNEETLIDEVLVEQLPDECLLIGDTNKRQLINGATGVTQLPGGKEHDLAATIATVTACVALIREVLALYDDLSKRFGRRPTEGELVKEVSKRAFARHPELLNKIEAIVRSVVGRLSSRG